MLLVPAVPPSVAFQRLPPVHTIAAGCMPEQQIATWVCQRARNPCLTVLSCGYGHMGVPCLQSSVEQMASSMCTADKRPVVDMPQQLLLV